MKHDHKRGVIKDNALKALVTSPLFRTRVESKKKGKGSYNRKTKHKNMNYNGGNDGSHFHFFNIKLTFF